jgi:small GTP-binding protein
MGSLVTKVKHLFGYFDSPKRMLMIGLDAAGKTTILYKLHLGEVITTTPTIGFNVESVTYKNLTTTIWDIGGQDAIRKLWKFYYNNVDCVIYIVDSHDRDRIELAAEELCGVLSDDLLTGVPLLVYANKQDLPKAMSCKEVIEALKLPSYKNRKWFCQGSCATTADGLFEGLDWVTTVVKK